jgi:hypothetical protein
MTAHALARTKNCQCPFDIQTASPTPNTSKCSPSDDLENEAKRQKLEPRVVERQKASTVSKFIFLDVDGVLSCNVGSQLEKKPLTQLRRVISSTRASIVLTSEWRKHAHLKKKLEAAFQACALEILDETPVIHPELGTGQESATCMKPHECYYTRPQEIRTWLDSSFRSSTESREKQFVVVDDRDMVKLQDGSFLR